MRHMGERSQRASKSNGFVNRRSPVRIRQVAPQPVSGSSGLRADEPDASARLSQEDALWRAWRGDTSSEAPSDWAPCRFCGVRCSSQLDGMATNDGLPWASCGACFEQELGDPVRVLEQLLEVPASEGNPSDRCSRCKAPFEKREGSPAESRHPGSDHCVGCQSHIEERAHLDRMVEIERNAIPGYMWRRATGGSVWHLVSIGGRLSHPDEWAKSLCGWYPRKAVARWVEVSSSADVRCGNCDRRARVFGKPAPTSKPQEASDGTVDVPSRGQLRGVVGLDDGVPGADATRAIHDDASRRRDGVAIRLETGLPGSGRAAVPAHECTNNEPSRGHGGRTGEAAGHPKEVTRLASAPRYGASSDLPPVIDPAVVDRHLCRAEWWRQGASDADASARRDFVWRRRQRTAPSHWPDMPALRSTSPRIRGAALPKDVLLEISMGLRLSWNQHKAAALCSRERGESYCWRIQGMRSCFEGYLSLQAVLFPPLDVGPLTLAPIDRAPGAR